jgi:hypothetical protein
MSEIKKSCIASELKFNLAWDAFQRIGNDLKNGNVGISGTKNYV